MTLTIKRNHDGDPVCADCGHYFGIGVKAMEWTANSFAGTA